MEQVTKGCFIELFIKTRAKLGLEMDSDLKEDEISTNDYCNADGETRQNIKRLGCNRFVVDRHDKNRRRQGENVDNEADQKDLPNMRRKFGQ